MRAEFRSGACSAHAVGGAAWARWVLSGGCEAEDRPADLGAPLAGRADISWSGQVGLVDGAVDGQGMPDHPGTESAVGDVDVVVRAGVDGDGKLGCGQFGDGDPAGLAWLTDGLEDGHGPSALGEQFVG